MKLLKSNQTSDVNTHFSDDWTTYFYGVDEPTAIVNFAICKLVKNIVIIPGVTTIRYTAFHSLENVTSVDIPDTVITIEDYAFTFCTGLQRIHIPNSVKSIGKGAFFNCTSLVNIKIPDSVTDISPSAFEGCIALQSIDAPDYILKRLRYPQTGSAKHSSRWSSIVQELQDDFDNGIDDPIYEATSAGSLVDSICNQIADKLGIQLEYSVRAPGVGEVALYDLKSGTSDVIDYQDFNYDVLDAALTSTSKREFIDKCTQYLKNFIA